MSTQVNGDFTGQIAGRDIISNEVVHKGNVCYVSFGANYGGQQIVGNGHLHIHAGAAPGVRVVIHPGPEHIDDMQRAVIRALVDKVVHLEKTTRRAPSLYKTVWNALNSHMQVGNYKMIRTRDYEKAVQFLLMWIGNLMTGKGKKNED